MTTAHKCFRAESVVLSLLATFLWIITGAALAAAQYPESPGQSRPKAPGTQVSKPKPQLTGINPSTAPPGGIGELVLTGKNLLQGIGLRIQTSRGDVDTKVRVESPVRAVATIHVPDDAPEGPALLELLWGYHRNREISPSGAGTPEVIPVPPSVKFTISKSAPMAILLGEYTLFPEEEIALTRSTQATSQQIQRTTEANRPSADQQAQIKKQQDEMKAMQEKYRRGEITQEQLRDYKMKAAFNMMGMMTPQQMAVGGQVAQSMQTGMQDQNRLTALQAQEKSGQLRLKQGSVIFLAEQNSLFTEPASALKEVVVVPPRRTPNANLSSSVSHEIKLTFNDGKIYCFRSKEEAEKEVSKLKMRLGK